MLELAPHQRIILAFDKSEGTDADFGFFHALSGVVGGVKLGLETMTAVSPGNSIPVYYRLLPFLRQRGFFVMADWKLKDIPNTVGKAVANIATHGAWGVTMHSDAGKDVIRAAVANRDTLDIIGVTVLTSISEQECKEIYGRGPRAQVFCFAEMLIKCGAQSIVCSPLELGVVERSAGAKLLRITPGIRAKDAPKDDQNRTMTASDAIKAGADYLVIGRPITQASDPVAAAQAIGEEIATTQANLSMI